LSALIKANLSEDIVLVYIDVSPDNMKTVNLYMSLVGLYAAYTNVYIMPIVCIEYIVLKWLHLYFNYLEKETFDTKRLLDDKDYVGLKQDYAVNSVELVCKRVLLHYSQTYSSCFSNKETRGNFYKDSCPCNSIRCKANVIPMLVKDKADTLYAQLPAYLCGAAFKKRLFNLGLICITDTYLKLLEKQRCFYIELANSLGILDFAM
jgi:hypothetical protein